MYETYKNLLHRNVSLKDAALELQQAAITFNRSYTSEIAGLMELKDDLVDSLSIKRQHSATQEHLCPLPRCVDIISRASFLRVCRLVVGQQLQRPVQTRQVPRSKISKHWYSGRRR